MSVVFFMPKMFTDVCLSVNILIFWQNTINCSVFSVQEGSNSLNTLFIARFHKYASLLRDKIIIMKIKLNVINE